VNIAYYDYKTGWTETADHSIEDALETVRDDGRVHTTSDETVGRVRVVEGVCAGQRFVLVGVIPEEDPNG